MNFKKFLGRGNGKCLWALEKLPKKNFKVYLKLNFNNFKETKDGKVLD